MSLGHGTPKIIPYCGLEGWQCLRRITDLGRGARVTPTTLLSCNIFVCHFCHSDRHNHKDANTNSNTDTNNDANTGTNTDANANTNTETFS